MHARTAGGPVDRRELLLSGKPRSTGPVDRQRALLSVPVPRSTGRSTAGSTVRILTVGRSTGRSTDRPTWLPTASFSSSINWDFWGLFSTRFRRSFWASFSYSFQWLYPQVLEPIFPNQKSVYQECFKSDFLEFSSTISILVFSHNT